jgi:hypothetical protein
MAAGLPAVIAGVGAMAQVPVQAVGYPADTGAVCEALEATWGVTLQIVSEIARQDIEQGSSRAFSGITASAISRGMTRAAL